jgi:site-specific recombinase XerD
MNGERTVVRVNIKGWFTTYKNLKSGEHAEYHYHRATGARLHGKPGSAEFIAHYAAAEKLIRDRHDGTFNGLVRAYTLSVEFEEKLAASTRAEYRRMLTTAEAEFGDMPIAALEDARVRRDFLDWRERVARDAGKREADNRLSAISAMLTWCVDRGRLPTNNLRGFKRLYHSDRSDIIWLPGHIDAFMRVAPIELQRAMIIALHTGQRQGDILRMPWSAYDGATIQLRPNKNNRKGARAKKITIKCTKTLRRLLNRTKRVSPLVLTTKTGQSFKKRYFAELWDRAMEAAGLSSVKIDRDESVRLHFHDLRGTAVTMLSEAGCTPQEIATITGHSLKRVHDILDKYLARTRHLADAAIDKFENSPRTKFANRLQTQSRLAVGRKEKTNG